MSEVQRFLRYMLPGLASVMLLATMFAITDGDLIQTFWDHRFSLSCQGVGGVFGVVLLSSALGYLLSIIYFAVLQVPVLGDVLTPDHRPLFRDLADAIEFRDASSQVMNRDGRDLSRRDAWMVVTRLWHTWLEQEPTIRSFDAFNKRLIDMMHSLGTTAVGVMIAMVFWCVVHFQRVSALRICWSIPQVFVWVVFLVMVWGGHAKLVGMVQYMAHANLAEVIRRQHDSGGKRVVIWLGNRK